jgi:hypothetical protein
MEIVMKNKITSENNRIASEQNKPDATVLLKLAGLEASLKLIMEQVVLSAGSGHAKKQ